MKLLVKCESVRGVRDANDKQVGEAVCFKAVHGLPKGTQPDVVTINITEEDATRWGSYHVGGLYSFVLTHHPKTTAEHEEIPQAPEK